MADVLRCFGYQIDRIPSTNYAGMEIDVEGTHIITGHPVYAECKCYESEVDSPKFQAFFGKFMTRWLKDKRAHGLFIAIPGVNPHAKGFYNENCEGQQNFTVRLCEEDAIIKTLFDAKKLSSPDVFARAVPSARGTAGEWNLLATEAGITVVQWIIPPGSIIPSQVTLLDAWGSPIVDQISINRILDLEPELKSYEMLTLGAEEPVVPTKPTEFDETVVEVKSGSTCFEFQFPAAPEYFVGRLDVLAEVGDLASKIIARATATRGLLFEAYSGWGKSSCVLACANELRKAGHFAVVIDSRSASSAQFILSLASQETVCPRKITKGSSGFSG